MAAGAAGPRFGAPAADADAFGLGPMGWMLEGRHDAGLGAFERGPEPEPATECEPPVAA